MADAILGVILNLISIFLYTVQFSILIRCIMSFLMLDEDDTVLMRMLTLITEPFVAPVRALMDRIPGIAGSMFDFSYAVTSFLLIIVIMFIE